MESGSWDGGTREVSALTWARAQEGEPIKDTVSHPAFNEPLNQDFEEGIAKATEMFDSVIQDDLEKEKSKVKELTARLVEKEKQLKLSERQTENLKRHAVVTQGVMTQIKEENKRLRNELNRLTVFRSSVRNYQEQNSNFQEHNSNYNEQRTDYQEQNSNGDHDNELIPSDMLTVSYTE